MKPRYFTSILLVCAAVTPAQASRALRVSMNGCSGWSAAEVERLARLELATVGGGESDVGGADVEITCDEAGATLRASDSQSRRSLERRVELAISAEDGQRLLAISAAQLVRALDWLPDSPGPRAVVTPPAAPLASQQSPSKPRQLEIQLSMGPRARDPAAPLLTYRGALGSTLQVGSGVALGGVVNFERGDAERSLGKVRTELVGAALQATLEPWRGNHWSCLWRTELGVSRLSLRGQDAAGDTHTGQIRGLGAEAQLAVGPVLRSAGFGIALLAQGGGSYFGGNGLVTGDADVNLNGAWAGVELAALWAP